VGDNGAVAIRALSVVVGILFVPLLGSLPAAAHTETVSVEPANGSRTTTLPEAVTIRAAEEVDAAQIVVTTPAARVEHLKVRIDGLRVSAPLPSDGPRGEYVVAYRLVAADGHATTGAVRFTVTAGAEPDFGNVQDAPSSSGVPVIGLSVGAVVLLVVGAVLVLAKARR
jgi:methionine-rich copper-binding protein CopC